MKMEKNGQRESRRINFIQMCAKKTSISHLPRSQSQNCNAMSNDYISDITNATDKLDKVPQQSQNALVD